MVEFDFSKIELENICKKYNLLVLVLFGSRVKENQKSNSDIDLAFYSKKMLTIEEEMNLFEDLLEIFEFDKIDLININTNDSPYLRNEVFSKGKCLYESKKGLFFDLKGNAFIDFLNFKKYYDLKEELMNTRINKRIQENG